MGFSRKRVGHDGRARYTAYYLDQLGRERSAGASGSRRQADAAWQRAQGKVAEGRPGGLSRGRQLFRTYVEQAWLPNHVMSYGPASTTPPSSTVASFPPSATTRWSRSCPAVRTPGQRCR